MYWASASWSGHFYAFYLLSDFFGPVLFITMSIFGTVSSLCKWADTGELARSDYRRRLLVRSSYLLLIGTVFNICYDAFTGFNEGPWALVKMNIFSAVALSQAITYATCGSRPYLKAIALVALLVVKVPLEGEVLRAVGYAVTPDTLRTLPGALYFVLFVGNPIGMVDTAIVAFAVSLAADEFVAAAVRPGTARRDSTHRKMVIASVSFMAASVLAGGLVGSDATGEASKFLFQMGPAWPWDAIPLLLVRHSSWNLLLKVGAVLCLASLLHRAIDVKGGSNNRVVKRVMVCGVYSFSIYVYHNMTVFIPLELDWYGWILASLLLAVAFVVAINAWNDKLGGVGSFEWGARRWAGLFRQMHRPAPLHPPGQQSPGAAGDAGPVQPGCREGGRSTRQGPRS
ncbi:MAG: hypothetical protein JW839_07270 [Candidatus Lokiarchaeota archaeon]|nr:hypothetical protein [Candidatus Lokiarchaeota archaeon]